LLPAGGIEVVGWIRLAEQDERAKEKEGRGQEEEKEGRGQEEEKEVARPPLTGGKYGKSMRGANRGLAARHTRVRCHRRPGAARRR
jgi:hypothetical protein